MAYRLKRCQVCGKEYQPASGRQKYCAECGPVVRAEQSKVSSAKWNRENPEKRKASLRANTAKWNTENPERRKANIARWDKENPERHSARSAKWSKENPERRKVSSKASSAKWERENPEKDAVRHNKYRAFKYANTPLSEMLTSTEWLAILAEANGHCAYCGKEAKLTLDHVVPLARGGKHSKDNVVPACNHCNCSKGKKTVEEWIRTTGKVLRDMNTQEATI